GSVDGGAWAKFAIDLGFRHVIIESGSLSDVLKLNSQETNLSEIKSNGNQIAHAMASKGMLRRGEAFWVEDALSLTLNRDATGHRCMDPP
ncbi:hypothetical protein Goshw_015662, partial [Gossypium schwendimanii]|nr:hypothetical protein [Gossypium schwendimanii]